MNIILIKVMSIFENVYGKVPGLILAASLTDRDLQILFFIYQLNGFVDVPNRGVWLAEDEPQQQGESGVAHQQPSDLAAILMKLGQDERCGQADVPQSVADSARAWWLWLNLADAEVAP